MTGFLSFIGACALLAAYDIFLRDKVIHKAREFFHVGETKEEEKAE